LESELIGLEISTSKKAWIWIWLRVVGESVGNFKISLKYKIIFFNLWVWFWEYIVKIKIGLTLMGIKVICEVPFYK
jgi:hypothetical protein